MNLKFFLATAYELMLPAFIFLRVHEKVLINSDDVQKEPNQAQKILGNLWKESRNITVMVTVGRSVTYPEANSRAESS